MVSLAGPAPASVSRPLLRVVSNADLDSNNARAAKTKADADDAAKMASEGVMSSLAGFIRGQHSVFKNHRNNSSSGWSDRLLAALRAFNGSYSASKLQEIRQFGGSEIYARIIAMKCRGASSLLRDVYLSPDRPWGLDAEASPKIPEHIMQSIHDLVNSESNNAAQQAQAPPPPPPQAPPAPSEGMQLPPPTPEPPPSAPSPDDIRDRISTLTQAALSAAKKNAAAQAQLAEDKLDTILTEGNFYKALAEFLVDLPLFPFAVIKGPVVRIVPSLKWVDGQATTAMTPRLFWNRISPFDIWWTPGVTDIEDAAVVERTRVTRADLNDLLDLPGYNALAIREVLDLYGRGGLQDDWDTTDAERAIQENRENPMWNQSGLITTLEYHGNVQGRMLLEYGMGADMVPDPMRDYFVQAWMIGRYIIKVQLSPSPRKRHPYFVTSFEKVPGTPVGNALPDILDDMQGVCNASLRALINNLGMASGPQVIINDDRIANDADSEEMFPWKRWHVKDPAMNSNAQKPIEFFQPQDNSEKLMAVYKNFSDIADDLSAIPKYLAGGNAGAAGRTASGLAMLMGNASKILQTVAANVDRDVFQPLLQGLYDMVMLTDTSGLLTGEESIKVMGVSVALQKETQRSRQLEFLQITSNPVDSQILGPQGRANLLRAVSNTLGLDGQNIIPSDDDIAAMVAQQKQQQAMQATQGGAQQPGAQQPGAQQGGSQQKGQPNQPGTGLTGGSGPVTSIAGGSH